MAKGGFPGMGGGNMNQMLRQAQKMQEDMLKAQQQLEENVYEATAGGAVAVKMSGKKEILELKIDPEAVSPEDVEILEDMIIAAVNDVLKKVEAASSSQMSKLTGGMNIPGLF